MPASKFVVVPSMMAGVFIGLTAVLAMEGACAQSMPEARARAGRLMLEGDLRWIVVASRQQPSDAIEIAQQFSDLGARVVEAANGWYAVVLGPEKIDNPDDAKIRFGITGRLPEDFYFYRGEKFVRTVWQGNKDQRRPAASLASQVDGQDANIEQCTPLSQTARILRTPNPNDIHPDWRDGAYIGTSWSAFVRGQVRTETGTYLKADLVTPRGGLWSKGVYILSDEWRCNRNPSAEGTGDKTYVSVGSPEKTVSAETGTHIGRPSDPNICVSAIFNGRPLSARNIREIVDEFKNEKLTKGEFETSDEFERRRSALKVRVQGRIQAETGGPYIVAIQNPGARYDADGQKLEFFFSSGYFDTEYLNYDDKERVIRLSRIKATEGSYFGTNAFGATVEVERLVAETVGLKVLNTGVVAAIKRPSITVPTGPERARQLKESAEVVVVAELAEPFIGVESRKSTATFDVPYEKTSRYITLSAKPICAALIDPTQKQVIQVFDN